MSSWRPYWRNAIARVNPPMPPPTMAMRRSFVAIMWERMVDVAARRTQRKSDKLCVTPQWRRSRVVRQKATSREFSLTSFRCTLLPALTHHTASGKTCLTTRRTGRRIGRRHDARALARALTDLLLSTGDALEE